MTAGPAAAKGVTASRAEKGGGAFRGIKLLLCENPLPPLPQAIDATRESLPEGNHYTEPYSAPLRSLIARRLRVAERSIHVNTGSELILRQLFDRFGQHGHLVTPTYSLFPEVAPGYTETPLRAEEEFAFDLADLHIPRGTTLAAIVNPNNPTGTVVDTSPLPELLRTHPDVRFLVDGAFIDFAGRSVVGLVAEHPNLMVTRTLSKAHSLAGFRVGYAVLPGEVADDLNAHNDAYPLARPSQAARRGDPATGGGHPGAAPRPSDLDGGTGRLPARHGDPDLPDPDLLLPGGFLSARRTRGGLGPEEAKRPHQAP